MTTSFFTAFVAWLRQDGMERVGISGLRPVCTLLRDGFYGFSESGWPCDVSESVWMESGRKVVSCIDTWLRRTDLEVEDRIEALAALHVLADLFWTDSRLTGQVYAGVDRLFGDARLAALSHSGQAAWLTLLATCNMWLQDAGYTAESHRLAAALMAVPSRSAAGEAVTLAAVNGYAYRMLDNRFNDELACRVAGLLRQADRLWADDITLCRSYALLVQGVNFPVPHAVLRQLTTVAGERMACAGAFSVPWLFLAGVQLNYACECLDEEVSRPFAGTRLFCGTSSAGD